MLTPQRAAATLALMRLGLNTIFTKRGTARNANSAGKPRGRAARYAGIALFMFFLIKGLLWLTIPAAGVAIAALSGGGSQSTRSTE